MDLSEQIDQLAATALRIAEERNQLLRALRNTINAVDQYGNGASSAEYERARASAIDLLTRF
jgi:hypothetical protein